MVDVATQITAARSAAVISTNFFFFFAWPSKRHSDGEVSESWDQQHYAVGKAFRLLMGFKCAARTQ